MTVLLGCQEPTYLWHPPFEETLGYEAIQLYEEAARPASGVLDDWQRLALQVAFALDPTGVLLCFEVALIVSRQNGKGEVLLALELAWLFLFGEKLIIHSAHLFETSREHFLKMQMLIQMNPDFDRRVFQMKEGRGSEEVILKLRDPVTGRMVGRPGARLKFMTRKGGAGRGFTGGKVVMDEAMYLDATMMAAGLPTMATRPEAQVVYAGSAGMKHSTQLAEVRRRGYLARRGPTFGDPSLALLEWAARKPVYDERGRLVDGDDPADPATWARVNPAMGPRHLGGRITAEYIRKEARTLGGFYSPEWWTERLGIGDYPEEEDVWEVIDKPVWLDAQQVDSQLVDGRPKVLAVDGDGAVTTLGIVGWRADGRKHLEVVARHRGSAWLVDKLLGEGSHDVYGELGLWRRIGRPELVVLKNGAAADVAARLRTRGVTVVSPTDAEYSQACAALVEDVRVGGAVHIGQQSLDDAVAAASKRENAEGGWRWSRDVRVDQAPVVVVTLGLWRLGKAPRSKIW